EGEDRRRHVGDVDGDRRAAGEAARVGGAGRDGVVAEAQVRAAEAAAGADLAVEVRGPGHVRRPVAVDRVDGRSREGGRLAGTELVAAGRRCDRHHRRRGGRSWVLVVGGGMGTTGTGFGYSIQPCQYLSVSLVEAMTRMPLLGSSTCLVVLTLLMPPGPPTDGLTGCVPLTMSGVPTLVSVK